MRIKLLFVIFVGLVGLPVPRLVYACTRLFSAIEVGTEFRVSVTDRGRPVSGLRVVLSPEVTHKAVKGAEKVYAVTDSKGYAEFSGMSSGSRYLSAEYDGDDPEMLVVDISPGTHSGVTVDLTWPGRAPMPVRSPSGSLRGPYYYPSQTQAQLALSVREGISGREIETTRSDSKGRFAFLNNLPAGIYFLQLDSSGVSAGDGERIRGTIPFEINAAAAHDALNADFGWTSCGLTYAERVEEPDLNLKRMCGEIVDPEGAVISKAFISLLGGDEDAKLLEEARSGQMGEFSLQERPGGTYQLVVTSPGFLPFAQRVHLTPIGSTRGCSDPLHVTLRVE